MTVTSGSVMVKLLAVFVVFLLATTNAQFGGRRCMDHDAQCLQRASIGMCTIDSSMSSICPFSCNFCGHRLASFPASPNALPSLPRGQAPPAPARRAQPSRGAPLPPPPRGAPQNVVPGIINRPSFECGKPVTRGVLNQDSRRGSSRPTRQATPQNERTSIIAGPPKVFCGATVISENFLLTTATCVLDPNNPISSVILGDLNILEDNEENSQAATYAIKQIIVHPEFNPNSNTKYNDVALLQTEKQIAFNEYVFPYCLSDKRPPPGTTVTGAGFGLVNETHSSGHLQEADLEVVETEECEDQYQEAGQIQRLKTAYPALLEHQDVLCAGFPGRGACKGDEGGPLFREDNEGRRYLVGVISFTGPCHHDAILPGVYTSVADHFNFINSVIYGGF